MQRFIEIILFASVLMAILAINFSSVNSVSLNRIRRQAFPNEPPNTGRIPNQGAQPPPSNPRPSSYPGQHPAGYPAGPAGPAGPGGPKPFQKFMESVKEGWQKFTDTVKQGIEKSGIKQTWEDFSRKFGGNATRTGGPPGMNGNNGRFFPPPPPPVPQASRAIGVTEAPKLPNSMPQQTHQTRP